MGNPISYSLLTMFHCPSSSFKVKSKSLCEFRVLLSSSLSTSAAGFTLFHRLLCPSHFSHFFFLGARGSLLLLGLCLEMPGITLGATHR